MLTIYIEEYFDTRPDEYYGSLKIKSSYSENPNPDLTQWIEFFVGAIEIEMTRVEAEVREYLKQEDLRKDLRKQEINRRQFQVVKYLHKYGQIQSHEYAKRFKCSRETAVQDLKELVERGLLEIQSSGPQLRYVLK